MLVDGAAQPRGSTKLHGGETVDVDPAPLKPLRAEAEDIELDILYEDEDIAVINKPAGMIVHSGAGAASGTLVNALLHHFESLSQVSGELRPGIVHRLDRLTSGVLMVAKHDRSHLHLQKQFLSREIQKTYWAVVQGNVAADPNTDLKILRHGRPLMSDGHWWVRFEMPIRRDRQVIGCASIIWMKPSATFDGCAGTARIRCWKFAFSPGGRIRFVSIFRQQGTPWSAIICTVRTRQ